MAGFNLGDIFATLKMKTEGVKESAKEFNASTESVKDNVKQQQQLTDTLKKGALVLTGVSAGLTLYAKSATDFTVDLAKGTRMMARETGASEEEASKLLYVTRRLGIESDAASTIFGIFSKNIIAAGAATSGTKLEQQKLTNEIEKTRIEIKQTNDEIKQHGDKTGELKNKVGGLEIKLKELNMQLGATGDGFAKLGLKVRNEDGTIKTFNQLLLEVSDKFKGLPDGAEKTALAMELFGRSGKDMLPVLNLGSAGIQELQKRAEELGLTLSKESVGNVMKYVKAQKDLKDVQDSLKLSVGMLTTPVLTKFNEKIAELATRFVQTEGPVKDVTANVLAFGGPVVGATAATGGFLANLTQIAPRLGGAVTRFGAYGAAATATAAATGALTWKLTELHQKSTLSTEQIGWLKQGVAILGGSLGQLAVVVSNGINIFAGEKIQKEQLKGAYDNLKMSIDGVKNSQKELEGANISAQSAALNVEGAQKSYNQAVAQFGPDSFEARQAANNLTQAQQGLRDANDRVADATQRVKDRQNEAAGAAQNVRREIGETARVAQEGSGAWDRLGGAVSGAFGAFVNMQTLPFRAGASELKKLLGKIPGFAGGVENFSGGWALVGERGPELVNLPRGSDVLPNDTSKKIAQNTGGASAPAAAGGIGELHLHMNGVAARSRSDLRDIGFDIVAAMDEALSAKGKPTILGARP